MNKKNEQLLKIGLDVVRNCDDFFVLQKLYTECNNRIFEISKNNVRPIQIGYLINES